MDRSSTDLLVDHVHNSLCPFALPDVSRWRFVIYDLTASAGVFHMKHG